MSMIIRGRGSRFAALLSLALATVATAAHAAPDGARHHARHQTKSHRRNHHRTCARHQAGSRAARPPLTS